MYYQNYEDYMRQVLGYPINDPSIYETYDYRNMPNYTDTYLSRTQSSYASTNLSEDEIKNFYPDIYNLVNPMVCKVCETNTQPVTNELIEKMTDEVYMAIEDTSTVVNVRVETPNPKEVSNTKKENLARTESSSIRDSSSRNSINKDSSSRTLTPREEIRRERSKLEKNISREATTSRENTPISKTVNIEKEENKKQTREVASNQTRQNNSILRDLIKILILNQIFGGNRPPVRPPRPPFPGGPGMPPPPRPPFPGGPRPPMGPGPVRPPIQPREGDYTDYLKF